MKRQELQARQDGPAARAPASRRIEAAALVTTALASILLGLAGGRSPAEALRGWPIYDLGRTTVPATGFLAAIVAAVAALLVAVGARAARRRGQLRTWLGTVAYCGFIFGYIWFVLPGADIGPSHAVVGGVVLFGSLLAARVPWRQFVRRSGGAIRRRFLFWDAALVLLPVALGLLLRQPVAGPAILKSALTYPLYALVQLTAFLFVPGTILLRLGFSRRSAAGVCAALFALAHWPNLFVMLATGGAMAVWATTWFTGRPAWQVAVVMGLAATAFTQFLPLEWTGHVKVGPGLVRQRTVDALAVGFEPAGAPDGTGWIDPQDYLAAIYPQILGREASATELAAWADTLLHQLRCSMPNVLVRTPEYRQLAAAGNVPPAPDVAHWTEAPPDWRGRFAGWGSQEYWQAHGADFNTWYRACWSEVFQRPFPPTAGIAMKPALGAAQRGRLVEVLHEHRRRWSRAPFTGISAEELAWLCP